MEPGQVYQGDCVKVMKAWPDACVDAVCTDPPYLLSPSSKSNLHCMTRILADVRLPYNEEGDPESFQKGRFAVPSCSGSSLGFESRAARIKSRVGMPEGSIDLQDTTIGEEEINAGSEPPGYGITDRNLSFESDLEGGKDASDFILALADRTDFTGCDGACCCFTEPGLGLLRVPVIAPRFSDGPSANMSGADIGLGHDSCGESFRSPLIMTDPRAIANAVLCLDLRRGTGELFIADRAAESLPVHFQLIGAEDVRTRAGAGRFSSMFEPLRIRVIDTTADRTFTLHVLRGLRELLQNSTSRGFMGKNWDGQQTPQAAYRFHLAWAREAFRILKPGGHLLAFGGTRTSHRLMCAVEDAGFEIRDTILAWVYGSGFPKSLDVSKAIDKAAGAEREVVGSKSTRIPGGTIYAQDEWSQKHRDAGPVAVTAPATEEAKRWEGWGTALKPGHEPIVMARKPLDGTVADNVLKHGTGAINIDGCRVATGDNLDGGAYRGDGERNTLFGLGNTGREYKQPSGRWPPNLAFSHHPECRQVGVKKVRGDSRRGGGKRESGFVNTGASAGDGTPCAAGHASSDGTETVPDFDCHPDCPVRELGEQSGELHGHGSAQKRGSAGWFAGAGSIRDVIGGESGTAARFFPCFQYQAKASTAERNLGLLEGEHNIHPTCKPIDLMRWLVRLITPPEGIVLDPFLGSGSTVLACILEGASWVGIEGEADYVDLARKRIQWAVQYVKRHGRPPLEMSIGEVIKRSDEADSSQGLLFEEVVDG